ncbi:MAG: tetrahydromethanopterin S-methyltransferase subunit C, partial [Lachnospiraceae bacterium]|nr:tetrahydromethanopterin S-methyltransferase subunit C [Lachnospiraceae bacterium]
MSAGGSGAPAEGAVDANVMLAIGIIGGLLGIYLSGINPVIGPVLSCLGAVCAILWGVIAIRSVASYGLGTGVPSIGYMSLGIGVIGALAGVGIIAAFNLTGLEIAGPILAL